MLSGCPRRISDTCRLEADRTFVYTSSALSGLDMSMPLIDEMVSPFWRPIFANSEFGRIAYILKPLGLPSLIDGTMRAERAATVGSARILSTRARSMSYLVSSIFFTPLSTAARRSLSGLAGSATGGGGGGGAAATAGAFVGASSTRSTRLVVLLTKSTDLGWIRF